MKNTVLAIGVLAVALLGVIAFTTKETDAYQGDYTQVGPNHTQEREAEMEKIFESKDYEAWVEIMTQDGRKPGVLNKIVCRISIPSIAFRRDLPNHLSSSLLS